MSLSLSLSHSVYICSVFLSEQTIQGLAESVVSGTDHVMELHTSFGRGTTVASSPAVSINTPCAGWNILGHAVLTNLIPAPSWPRRGSLRSLSFSSPSPSLSLPLSLSVCWGSTHRTVASVSKLNAPVGTFQAALLAEAEQLKTEYADSAHCDLPPASPRPR